MNDYFNTTGLKGDYLEIQKYKAKSLQQTILNYFMAHPTKKLTPPQVQGLVGAMDKPLTSIRRAMTNLTDNKDLINTHETAPGRYGQPNFKWRLNTSTHPVKYEQLTII